MKKKFRVGIPEKYIQYHIVEAEDVDEAIDLAQNECGEVRELEYVKSLEGGITVSLVTE